MPGHRIVFGDPGRAVVIVVLGVGDIGAMAVLKFDFKAMTNGTRVINRVEVVDASVGNAGFR